MPDDYQAPALILTALLLPSFGYLYLRFRDIRFLLWFLGFLLAIVRMALTYRLGPWDFSTGAYPWLTALGQTSIQVSATLFLASLSPRRFQVGPFRVLYVIPYAIPLVVYSIVFEGVFRGGAPGAHWFWLFPLLSACSLVAGFFWGMAKGNMPSWLGTTVCAVLGSIAFWIYFAVGGQWPLSFAENANHLMTAILLILVFRRLSPGLMLAAVGFSAWSLFMLRIFPSIENNPAVVTQLLRIVVMGKVVAGIGLILLVLEEQLGANLNGQERERRVRRELEAYTSLILARSRVDHFDQQAAEICQTVTKHSRFSQAALLLLHAGRFRLAGSAGLDPAVVEPLEELAARIPIRDFLLYRSETLAVEHSHTLRIDLTRWMQPGDDLKRLRFTSVLAIPMAGRTSTEGVLLLAGMRNAPAQTLVGSPTNSNRAPLRPDDLLPIELLTTRLQATLSQSMMLEKLIDSEKYAGLGQLAGSMTEQLNDPLTVILGYASLLQETSSLEPRERKGVESILAEARHMRSILQSLTRISRPQSGQLTAVSVSEMLTDMEQLYRAEFLRRSIEFRLSIAPGLPRVLCHSQQLRQAVLHCLQYAIDTVESERLAATGSEKTVNLEATSEDNVVRILIAHSGPGFVHPDRAFDPFVPAQASGETASLGLSLCATILREQNGRASAVNLEPRGAAILLELQAA